MARVTHTQFEWFDYRLPAVYRGSNYELCALPSEIDGAGSGLFVTVNIKRKSLIGEYIGRIIPAVRNEQVRRHFDNGYLMDTVINGKKCYIDGSDLSINIMGFANHAERSSYSCNMVCKQRKNGRCFFYARRNIRAGEELLFEYAEFIEFIK